MKCDYGCGQESLYVLGKKHCCSNNWRKCPAVREKNSNSLKKAYSEGRGYYNYDSLPAETKRKMSRVDYYLNLPWNELKDIGYMRKRVFIEQDHTCLNCNEKEWMDKPIPLEVDHIDGNNGNWKRDNVRAICPNCHALTKTYRGRNINSGTYKVSDNALLAALNETTSIRQALLKCGLAAKGGNYDRVKRLLANNTE